MELFRRYISRKNKIHKTEAYYKDVYDKLPDMYCSVDASTGQILQCNETLCATTGYDCEEVVGRPVFDLYHHDCVQRARQIFQQFQITGQVHNEELQLRKKDGGKLYVSLSATAYRDSSGKILYSRSIWRDITELKYTQRLFDGQQQVLEMIASNASLAESLTALARLIDAQDARITASILLLEEDGIHIRHGAAPRLPWNYITAIDGLKIGPNAGSCGTAAYRREPVFVENIDTDPLWSDYKSLVLPHGLRACWSTPIFGREGQVLGTFAIYYDQPAMPTALHLHLINIATHIAAIAISHHLVDSKLEQSHTRLHNLFEQANEGIYIIAAEDNRFIDVNPRGAELLGYSRDELLRLGVADVLASREQARLAVEPSRIMRGERHLAEWELLRKNDSTFPGEVNAHRLDDNSYLAIMRDLSERRLAEANLRKSEEKLRLFIRYSPSAIAMFDQNMRYLVYSRRWLLDYRLGDRDITGLSHYEVFPDVPEKWKQIHRRCLGGAIEKCEEEPFHRTDGTIDWLRWEIHPWWAGDTKVGGIIIFTEVITERKGIEQELKISEERFRATVEQAAVGIAHVAADGQWLRVNQKLCDIVGYSWQELMNLTFQDITHPDDLEQDLDYRRRLLAGEIPNYAIEKRYFRKDGQTVWINLTVALVRRNSGEPEYFIAVIEDISDRKAAEQKLFATNQQLEILSRKILATQENERRQVARELHDEIGQLLTVVKLDLQTVLRQPGSEVLAAALREGMESIDQVVARVRDLSLNLRPSMLDDLGLLPTLRWYVQRQAQHLGEEFDIDLVIPPTLPQMKEEIETACFRVAQEAITNILRHSHARHIKVTLAVVDNWLDLMVVDNGKGFDTGMLRQSFGLLGMQERTELTGGHFTITSNAGKGTTVHACFPLQTTEEADL